MDLLSGSFGEGSVHHYRGTISINPRGLFSKSESVSIGDIVEVQQVGGDASKKFGETAALGGVGLAVGSLLGPVGALAGLAAGAMAGGKKSHVTFVCRLRDGRNFVARARASEFGELWALFQNQISSSAQYHETKAVEVRSARTVRKKKTRTASSEASPNASQHIGETAIPGRARAKPPEVRCDLYDKLKEQLATATEDVVRRALPPVLAYANDLHQTKWRLFDTLLKDEDVHKVMMLRTVIEEQKVELLRSEVLSSRGQADKDRSEAKSLHDDPRLYSGPEGFIMALEYYSAEWKAEMERRSKLDPLTIGRLARIDDLEDSSSKLERIARAKEEEANEREENSEWLVDAYRSLGQPDDVNEFRTQYIALMGSNALANMDNTRLSKDAALQLVRELLPDQGSTEADAVEIVGSSSVKTRLTDLKGLLDAGLISDAEYHDQRRRILDAI